MTPGFEKGTVWLAGAGPGDPGLLTLLAVQGLREADVILHDALVDPAVLDYAGPQAEIRYVGKRAGKRCNKQHEITDLMIDLAQQKKRVLRLKGGDPFVFGRGGEEAIALALAGIRFRVIPGITAAIGGTACAGIPVTHRDINSVVSFVTGHDSTGNLPGDVDWDALAAGSPVIVFYMARRTMPEIARRLMAAGRGAQTPVAVIENATVPGQRVSETTLGACGDLVHSMTRPDPAMIVVGEAVRVRALLMGWQHGAHEAEPFELPSEMG